MPVPRSSPPCRSCRRIATESAGPSFTTAVVRDACGACSKRWAGVIAPPRSSSRPKPLTNKESTALVGSDSPEARMPWVHVGLLESRPEQGRRGENSAPEVKGDGSWSGRGGASRPPRAAGSGIVPLKRETATFSAARRGSYSIAGGAGARRRRCGLGASDPNVLDRCLDGRCRAAVLRDEYDPDRLAGPRGHRDGNRRP